MMNRIMLSCETVTELIEKKHRASLSFKENMQLFAHTAMCSACKQYKKQSLFLEQLFKSKEHAATKLTDQQTTKLENDIIKRLP